MSGRIPDKVCIPQPAGEAAESRAWQAALELFAAHPSPAWAPSVISPPNSWPQHHLLSLDGILSSVWIDRASPQTPFIIDQLWVVSWLHQPSLSFIVGIEVDGGYKWNDQKGEWATNPKDRSVQRSFEILSKGVALFRVSSKDCETDAGALNQIQSLWDRLTTAAFLHRMNLSSFAAQDLRDVDAAFDLACREYTRHGDFLW
ncbi:hypothetical protein QTI51_24510 [Variovorax sp. J22G73]|uniref:hypothetical protein n=1 Tax=unclassified Variovorax TaxID=663243 RepID=UPI002576B465|nr:MULTISPECIES: hypothetical protein [unclassified Variovorax]MDM0007915.1 hypothetical protein [Variovorax sp. J22R203]MDM0100463.1 hypothetical protein [Variovorax sp. J22G73]